MGECKLKFLRLYGPNGAADGTFRHATHMQTSACGTACAKEGLLFHQLKADRTKAPIVLVCNLPKPLHRQSKCLKRGQKHRGNKQQLLKWFVTWTGRVDRDENDQRPVLFRIRTKATTV